jgi:hypothetical protein
MYIHIFILKNGRINQELIIEVIILMEREGKEKEDRDKSGNQVSLNVSCFIDWILEPDKCFT